MLTTVFAAEAVRVAALRDEIEGGRVEVGRVVMVAVVVPLIGVGLAMRIV